MKQARSLDVSAKDLHCRLTRIGDRRYRHLVDNSIAIKEDGSFMMNLYSGAGALGELNLAEIYAAFRFMFGESGSCFDDYKGSFSFPFEVKVSKRKVNYLYALNIANWRGSAEFLFRKVIPAGGRRFDRIVVHAPFPREFSAGDMNGVVASLYGHARDVVRILRKFPVVEEFAKKIDSNLILYGLRHGTFFEEEYKDAEQLVAAWREAKATLDRPVA